MDAKIYAVIDTNVLVSALFSISGNSNPSIIIRKIIDGVITPLYNEDILAEYEEALNRDKFPFRKADIDWLISAFLDYGISLGRTAISDEIFIDKDDIVFYEVALSKEDSFLVTGNIKHFPKKPFIVTPAEMLTIIDEMEVGPGRILNEQFSQRNTFPE
mgnify:FL=1